MFSKTGTDRTSSKRPTPGTGAQSSPAEKVNTLSPGQSPVSLPGWLAAAINPALVQAAMVDAIPEFSSGKLVLHRCEAKRLRFRDSKGVWRGLYLLTIADGAAATPQVRPLQATLLPPGLPEPPAGVNDQPFGAAQWRCYLPTVRLELSTQAPDTELTMLPALTDPEASRRLLEASIRNGGSTQNYHDLQIQACVPKVMRYKPGSRCTVLYHLDYGAPVANRNWPAVVVAKTYHGDKGQNAFTSMQALWRSPLGNSRTVTIAEPLAYLPEDNVLVQGPIRQEMTLKELIQQALKSAAEGGEGVDDGALTAYLSKTVAGLIELHQCGVRYGETVTWEAELAEIYQLRAALTTPLPHLAHWADALLDQIQALAAAHPADPAAPAHRSFRPAQVLLHQGTIGFIDFDGFCQAEPALDLALFMTTIKNIALNKATQTDDEEEEDAVTDPTLRLARLTQAEALCDRFLAEYTKHAPVSHTRIILWETLNLLSLVLSSWSKLKLARLENCLFLLERHRAVHGLQGE